MKRVSIAWTPNRNLTGIDHLDDLKSMENPQIFEISPSLKKTFETEHESDAHFVTYQVRDSSNKIEEAWPRLNKSCFFSIEESNSKVVSRCIALDYDLPSHGSWTNPAYEDFFTTVQDSDDELLQNPSAFYLTEHGARWVYILKEPLHVADHEGYYKALISRFSQHGLKFDVKCAQWNRLFRLPFVYRGDQRTLDNAFIRDTGVVFTDYELDLSEIEPAHTSVAVQSAELELDQTANLDMPEDIELFRPAYYLSSKTKMPGWMEKCKKLLKGREVEDHIFNVTPPPLAHPGSRDSSVMEAVGCVVSLTHMINGMTLDKAYGLLYDTVAAIETDQEHPDWTQVLWDKLQRVWIKEKRKEAFDHIEKHGFWANLRANVSEWYPPLLGMSDADQNTWIKEHALVCIASGNTNQLYMMQPSGYYDHMPVNSSTLYARVRELGMQEVIPLCELSEGKLKPIPVQATLNTSLTLAHRAEVMGCERGTYIQNLDTKSPILRINTFQRADHEPTYDAEIDELYYMMCDEDDEVHHLLKRWIAWSIAVNEGPICALALIGAPASGKKMFVQGLAECFTSETVAEQKEFSGFQSQLFHTPLLLLDEGIPKPKAGQPRFVDQFRHLVSGDGVEGERKYQDIVKIRTPVRILITANNVGVIRELMGTEDLTKEDREAIEIRLLHIQVSYKAKKWLEKKGGRLHTAGWVANDTGVGSKYKIAKFNMWLYQNRHKFERDKRLLVQGATDQSLFKDLILVSNLGPLVADLVIQMIEYPSSVEGLFVGTDGSIKVLTKGIHQFANSSPSRMGMARGLSLKKITDTLKALCLNDLTTTTTTITTPLGRRRGRWHNLNPLSLLNIANRFGMPCAKLAKIASKQLGTNADPKEELERLQQFNPT